MNETIRTLIDKVKADSLSGIVQPKETIVTLLGISQDSDEYRYLCQSAYEASKQITGGEAYLWGAIGVDFAVCPMNCRFCSLGEAWGIVKESKSFSQSEIISQIQEYVQQGIRFIVLRTTEFYSIDTLCDFLKSIRCEVPGEYELVLNIGEFDLKKADKIHASGADGVYHALRLREGIDTIFDPKDRLNTLASVRDSQLKLIHLVEPVGPEHTNEEIADVLLNSIRYGVVVSGAMARTPVKGTPLGELPALSEKRLAQIIAVTRLCSGVRDICAHPPSKAVIQSGANVVVIERGAIPRDTEVADSLWNAFTPDTAKAYFTECGYQVIQKRENVPI
ncbi:radical SAM protein [Ruminococcus sp. 5_1_39BFAA]|uniref:radical SAM protein n=1 Tax=Ruminococcus sp. 5_1_39BFAA TaxID=457412 RepID=UPI003565F869